MVGESDDIRLSSLVQRLLVGFTIGYLLLKAERMRVLRSLYSLSIWCFCLSFERIKASDTFINKPFTYIVFLYNFICPHCSLDFCRQCSLYCIVKCHGKDINHVVFFFFFCQTVVFLYNLIFLFVFTFLKHCWNWHTNTFYILCFLYSYDITEKLMESFSNQNY